MTAAERRAAELREALNAAYPADNHDSLDDSMRIAMLTLSREEVLRHEALTAAVRPAPPPRGWRRWLATLAGSRGR